MKAVAFDRYGTNEVVGIRDVPMPVPGAGDVLIKVRAASINPLDWKVREGMAKVFTGRKFPKVLGSECAGEVIGRGRNAVRFGIGDRVVAMTGVRRLGAFAEYACASEATVYPLPKDLAFEHAACLPIAGLTALQGLRDHGKIAPSKRVLINGASGGVGHIAVQIAKVLGAQVTAVCSARNLEFVRSLGADTVIDHQREDFAEGNEVFDLIFDVVSTRTYRECSRVLAERGVYVNTLPNMTVVSQFLTSLRPGKKARSMWVRPNAADMDWLAGKVAAGTVRIEIERTYTLAQIRDALAVSQSGRARGKLVLSVA